MARGQDARPAKRARSLEATNDTNMAVTQTQVVQKEESRSLLSLPDGVLHLIMSHLPASSLFALGSVSRYFRNRDGVSGLLVTHRVAKDSLVRMVGQAQANRWRDYNWIQRLAIEETATGFDRVRSAEQEFAFKEEAGSGTVTEVSLHEPGPRMLLSDMSTADSPILRWKLQLRGNNAAEFGVVPVDLQDTPKALHKCLPSSGGERGMGFSSAITVGSMLPVRLPVMRGTVVEVLATPHAVSFIVVNPKNGKEMIWQNNSTVPREYTGPLELDIKLPCKYDGPIKLAVTAWQRASFGVLHTLVPEEQQRQEQTGQKQEEPVAQVG